MNILDGKDKQNFDHGQRYESDIREKKPLKLKRQGNGEWEADLILPGNRPSGPETKKTNQHAE